MKSRVTTMMSMLLLLHLFLSALSAADPFPVREERAVSEAVRGPANSLEAAAEWRRVIPPGEEFMMLAPVAPSLVKLGGDYLMSGTSERILDHRLYSGYAGQFNFYIESYKAARPRNLWKVLDDERYPLRVMEDEIKFTGYDAKQYRLTHENYYGKYFEVVTRKHIYLVTLASRGADNDAVARFIAGLQFGESFTARATGQVLDVRESPGFQQAITKEAAATPPSGKAYKPSETSRKAVIVSRPEPTYTDEARREQVAGTVVLRAQFGADGYVTNIRVVSGLEHGLTQKAIEAALAIRFFPAEKDGQPVSQYIQIEYNFNLY